MTDLEIIVNRISAIPGVLIAAPEMSSWDIAHSTNGEPEQRKREQVIFTRTEAEDVEFGYLEQGVEHTIRANELSFLELGHPGVESDLIVLCKPSVTTDSIVKAINSRIVEIEIDERENPEAIYTPDDYKAIEFWGRWMRSFDSYIKMEQEKAYRASAPRLAIYETDGEWQTLDKVKNPKIIELAKQEGLL